MSRITPKEYTFPDPVDIPVHGTDGASKGNQTFTPGGVRNFPNIPLLKEAVRRYQGNLRSGTASTKERGEVHGSNAKPWRQKGTGRARQGTKNASHWRGGGVTFGPKPRNYHYGLPKAQRRLATRHALLTKILDGETKILDGLAMDKPNTALVARALESLGVIRSCLIGVSSSANRELLATLARSCANLDRVEIVSVADFNAHALLKYRNLVLTPEAFDEVQSREDALRSAQGSDA
ncbi:MAG: 50S ribosomal protein L4 [Planctomycetota bacterium]